jgi:hypothetical protein
VEVLSSISGVEARAACSSRSLDLFPMSSCFESESDGAGSRFAVDCSALECLPSSLAGGGGGGWVCEVEEKAEKLGIIGLRKLLWFLRSVGNRAFEFTVFVRVFKRL